MLGDALGTEGGCAGVGVRECRYGRQRSVSVWAAVEGGALNNPSSGRARATAMARRTWEWLAPVQGDQGHREACGKHVGLGWAPLGCFDRDECSNHRPFPTTENAPRVLGLPPARKPSSIKEKDGAYYVAPTTLVVMINRGYYRQNRRSLPWRPRSMGHPSRVPLTSHR